MTDEAYSSGGRIPAASSSAAGRLALKRAALSVGAALVGGYGLGAILTYSPEDPSFNVASDERTHNLFGAPGAFFADAIIQTLGAAAPLALGALLAAGALRIARRRLVARIDKRRVGMAALGVTMLAAAASTIPTPEGWPLGAGFGGVVGDGISGLIAWIIGLPGLPFPHVIAGLLCAAAGVFACGWAFHLKPQDVRTAAEHARRAASGAGVRAQRALTYVADKTRRDEEERYATPIEDRRAERVPERPRPAPRVEREEPRRPAPSHRRDEEAAPAPRQRARTERREKQQATFRFGRPFELPEAHLLATPRQRVAQADAQTLHAMSRQLEGVLADYGVQGEIVSARPGPVVTLFEFEPAAGVKSSRVVGLADDIARSMSATAARVAVIPGRNAMGIELPNPKRETVYLRSLLTSSSFAGVQGELPLALGETIEGDPFAADLTKMPHLLIAGTTGSGKSVGINAMILSLLYRHTPDECRFIMIDPKM
ncbi:MAG: DNA translocase FtsK 4TM domain-containing protein, partial [Hyphomonadaceae bacterium]